MYSPDRLHPVVKSDSTVLLLLMPKLIGSKSTFSMKVCNVIVGEPLDLCVKLYSYRNSPNCYSNIQDILIMHFTNCLFILLWPTMQVVSFWNHHKVSSAHLIFTLLPWIPHLHSCQEMIEFGLEISLVGS